MRALFFASIACLLAACGGPETSHANNAQANVSKDSRPAPTAAASVAIPASANAVSGNQAKAARQ